MKFFSLFGSQFNKYTQTFGYAMCSSYAIHMFIELPNKILQLLAKHEQSQWHYEFFSRRKFNTVKKIGRNYQCNTQKLLVLTQQGIPILN